MPEWHLENVQNFPCGRGWKKEGKRREEKGRGGEGRGAEGSGGERREGKGRAMWRDWRAIVSRRSGGDVLQLETSGASLLFDIQGFPPPRECRAGRYRWGGGLEAPSMEQVKLKSEAKPAVPAALPTPPGTR